jgi:hypothetical protein
MRVALGMARNATEADFRFVPRKVLFPFSESQNQVFFEAATETRNRKLGKTPHINSRPPGIHISALFLLRQSSKVFFEFCASSTDFAGTGVVFLQHCLPDQVKHFRTNIGLF